jgi:hypothetical protein
VTGHELKLETIPGDIVRNERKELDTEPTEFYVIGNRTSLSWLASAIDHLLKNPMVGLVSSEASDDRAKLTVRIVPEGTYL